MISVSAKTIALAAIISFSALMSGTAQAAILHSTSGEPVMTASGVCVTTGFEGSAGCGVNAAAPAQETVDMMPMKMVHHESVYFDFNKSVLTTKAQHRLDHLVKHLRKMGGRHHHHNVAAQNITIVGFADRLGNAEYNETLALKRAQAVRAYLVAKGIKAEKLEVQSLGKTIPNADCSADLPRAKLIRCLREDRRVEIQFGGECAR